MKKIAVVHEWLTSHAGSEKVVEQILKKFILMRICTAWWIFLPENLREFIQYKTVTTSFIQNLPFAKRHFRSYLPLMPTSHKSNLYSLTMT